MFSTRASNDSTLIFNFLLAYIIRHPLISTFEPWGLRKRPDSGRFLFAAATQIFQAHSPRLEAALIHANALSRMS